MTKADNFTIIISLKYEVTILRSEMIESTSPGQ